MRVLHVISDENIGGAGVLLSSLLRNFDRTEIKNLVALPQNSALRTRIGEGEARLLLLENRADRLSAKGIFEICKVIRATAPDLVHTNAAVSARVAARICHVPIVHTRHCSFPITGKWKNPIVRAVGGAWNRCLSDRVIATAEAAKRDLELLGIPEHRIRVILNGSEPIRELGEEELAQIRCALGISPNEFTVGICARLVPCKGHRIFLEAAGIICKEAPDLPFRFLIVGEGEERNNLELLARELEIADRVIFTGFVEDMARIYRILRLNVNCSVGTETSCLALSEGMSAGVPCVVSDYGGNCDMVGDSLAGIVYPMGDSEQLAKWILKIATDEELEYRMRQDAYERYRERYTAHAMADRVSSLYREILAEKQKKNTRFSR